MAVVTWKCPNCGGGLQFDPATQKFECEYCLSQFTKEQLAGLPPDLGEEQAALEEEQGSAKPVLYVCPSCGAEIVTEETTAATFCFYCHNPVVLKGRLEGGYEPDFVLPFAIEKEKAKQIFLEWLKKKRFVPKDFYGPEQIEKLTGVYFPYWLYSCQVKGEIQAEGVKLRVWRAGNVQYTETQKYDVSRSGNMQVEHVSRNALRTADKQLVEGVMPFDMKQMKRFSIEFLAGFFAEKRDMERQEFKDEVEAEVQSFAADTLKSSISGYNRVEVKDQRASLRGAKWDYALLPVWTLTYTGKRDKKIYYFACNGQTGKICGKLPVDTVKLGFFFLEIFLPLLAVLLVAGYLI